MRLKANAAYATDTGRIRSHNQDAARIGQDPQTEWPAFIVADGMGGHAAGEIAAGVAVDTLLACATDPAGPPDPDERVRQAIVEAQQRIAEAAAEDATRSQMGTTCLLALLAGHRLHLGHVGDSRAYLFRDGRLEQLTSDHSWVSEQVRAGMLAPDEAARHPMRHVITRALSVDPVEPDIIHRDLQPGDWLLLCTDGLTGPVPDATIADVLATAIHPRETAHALIDIANQAGGPDNITVLLVHLETVTPPAPVSLPKPADRSTRIGERWLVGLVIFLIAAAIAAAIFLLRPANLENPPVDAPVTTPESPGLPGIPRPNQ